MQMPFRKKLDKTNAWPPEKLRFAKRFVAA
jgi:hypothetical protein